jgi:hypothetical protein
MMRASGQADEIILKATEWPSSGWIKQQNPEKMNI